MMETDHEGKPRWMYRFDNYRRAFLLLREAIELRQTRELTQLEKEGVIQRFEYTWELSWKVLKDYLESEGVVLDKITPLSVIRAALEAKLITRGDDWMKALDAGNKMSHTYNVQKFEEVITKIETTYLALFDELHLLFLHKVA
jgi:nucleotidyltransferase substrate binding protein (TIGR01987 family)